MATIGNFTADKEGFNGTLRTLTLNVKAKLVPNDKGESEKAPDFRVQAASHDIGAAWKKTSEAGRNYLSVTIDDPSFPAPVYARLIEGEDGTHDLICRAASPRRRNRRSAPSTWRGAVLLAQRCIDQRGPCRVASLCAESVASKGARRVGAQHRRAFGLRPVPPSPSRPFGFNPSRLRACGAAR